MTARLIEGGRRVWPPPCPRLRLAAEVRPRVPPAYLPRDAAACVDLALGNACLAALRFAFLDMILRSASAAWLCCDALHDNPNAHSLHEGPRS